MIAGFVGFGRDGEIRTLVPRGIASRRRRQAVDRVTLKPLGHVAIGASPVLTERFVGCVGAVSVAGVLGFVPMKYSCAMRDYRILSRHGFTEFIRASGTGAGDTK